MQWVYDYIEAIVALCLIVVSISIYCITARKRGSFADTADWSKVIRRIAESSCVFIALLLIAFVLWDGQDYIKVLTVVFPTLGIITSLVLSKVVNSKNTPVGSTKQSKVNKSVLSEHLVNAAIVSLFILSIMFVFFITGLRMLGEFVAINYCYIVLDLLLSTELAFLVYQLYYLLVVNGVPNTNDTLIVRICNYLNENR